ncbi:hypothetical protein PINS_up002824 [Pythium insidiosum]|nr:hypothetical protein PINS_up002824 [Pythium insidiosum]
MPTATEQVDLHEKVATPNDDNGEDVSAQDSQSAFLVLVSTMDANSKPLLFFPYPEFLQVERHVPHGYQGMPTITLSLRPVSLLLTYDV